MNDVSTLWGQRIAAARAAAGLTQRELAARLDISQQAVQNWEQGRRVPRDRFRPLIAAALDVSTTTLFSYEETAA